MWFLFPEMVHSITNHGMQAWPIRIKFSREQHSHLLIEVESAGGGSDADVSVLNSHNVQIHEVSMHLPVARRRVPATHGQDLQALHRLQTEVKSKWTSQNKSKTSWKGHGKICHLLPSSLCSVAEGELKDTLCCLAECVQAAYNQSAQVHYPSFCVSQYLRR